MRHAQSDCPEIYGTRTSRATGDLSDAHFEVLNRDGSLSDVGGYCLDAPDQMPGGSMRAYGKTEPMILQSLIGRAPSELPVTAHAKALTDRLVAETLAKLKELNA